ncbi:hypothetical protein ADK57_41175 [Streptomyces sp. MMG1533]|uniref:hypothetical protein n=1 Tax=Streptomyces sp. MMG1533 TaxID=1415546 RepID=UPI0006B0131F|nr:hypothetical protein [Streptomyces sp. MMG1533]KOU56823.1 hypothetical protein ADK57_41175 [Streptomyces sp. MMG1533]
MTTVRASRFVSTVALSMCVAAMVGGCADGAGRDDAGEPRPVPRSAPAQDDLLKSAESALVQRCLTEREVALPAAGSRGSTEKAAAPRREFPYGIDDPAWAAEHGFGGAAETEQAQQQEQQTPQAGKRAAEQQQRLTDAMFGTGRRELSTRTATGLVVKANSDGCLAAAQRVLYGDQVRWFRTEVAVNNLGAAAHDRVTRDPAYRAALARWARCIAPVHKAEDPAELRSAWQRRARDLDPRQATDLQRRYAVAEARCVRSTDLADTGARLEKDHAADLRAEYADLIGEHRQMRDRGLRYAVRHGL